MKNILSKSLHEIVYNILISLFLSILFTIRKAFEPTGIEKNFKEKCKWR